MSGSIDYANEYEELKGIYYLLLLLAIQGILLITSRPCDGKFYSKFQQETRNECWNEGIKGVKRLL